MAMRALTVGIILLISLLAVGGGNPANEECPGTGTQPYDYKQALCMSILFFEAQRSGHLPSDQRVTWRHDAALQDGSDVGLDLTGGYFDAGDYVKFGFPMAFTVTFLSWGMLDHSYGFETAGQTGHTREAIKWATDFFLDKAHTGYWELWGQVGDGWLDHAWWGRPEEMPMERPSAKIDADHPGSDLAGETAAALAGASMVFKDVDPGYSQRCLDVAKELFDFADQKRLTYDISIPAAADWYKSWSGYGDELCWSALWMYRATNDNSYLEKAKGFFDEFGLEFGAEQFSWDDKKGGTYALLSILDGDQRYKDIWAQYLNHLRNDMTFTPGGLIYLHEWGPLRHAANVAYLALMAARHDIDKDANRAFGESQANYILGSNGRSFVVGFGNNPPQRPHHRASSCADLPATCDWDAMENPDPNPQILYGALVGGPDENDYFSDDRHEYEKTEVGCDYNAGLASLLAAMLEDS